jgi:hypothetical protein
MVGGLISGVLIGLIAIAFGKIIFGIPWAPGPIISPSSMTDIIKLFFDFPLEIITEMVFVVLGLVFGLFIPARPGGGFDRPY